MKKLLIIIICVGISGCCGKIYRPYYATWLIQLNLDFHKKGFTPNDTVFQVTYYTNIDSFQYTDYTTKDYYNSDYDPNDSIRPIYISNLNCRKIIIKSITTGFKDSLKDFGYQAKSKHVGNKRCGYDQQNPYNVTATHKGQLLNSGSAPTLEITIKP